MRLSLSSGLLASWGILVTPGPGSRCLQVLAALCRELQVDISPGSARLARLQVGLSLSRWLLASWGVPAVRLMRCCLRTAWGLPRGCSLGDLYASRSPQTQGACRSLQPCCRGLQVRISLGSARLQVELSLSRWLLASWGVPEVRLMKAAWGLPGGCLGAAWGLPGGCMGAA